jgi:hypothetical protein
MNAPSPKPSQIVSRILASVLGGYGFVWGFCALGIALLVTAGMDYEEAWTFAMVLAFLVFLVAFCWAIAAASLARVWAVLAGGGGAMTLGAWLLTRHLVA